MRTKIAFISEHASPLAICGGVDAGGQNIYVAQTATHLARMGYEVDIFTRRESNDTPEVVQFHPHVRVIHVQAGPAICIAKEELFQWMPQFRDEMIRFINKNRMDYQVVHAHFYMSGWVAMELKKKLKIPFVVTFHALGQIRKIFQGNDDKFPLDRVEIETAIAQAADRIIAECPQDKDDLMKFYSASEDNISIVPCGFCPAEMYPVRKAEARKLLRLKENEYILLQLGRLVPRKGIENVINALAKLRDKVQVSLRLLVVGGESDEPDPLSTPEIGRLQKIANHRGVSDIVLFTGRKSRELLKYYYSAADVFITTPWYEPFGITPLEAMACGVPVVGSDVGGIKYSIVDRKTGFLVPPNDPVALADRLKRLVKDPALARRMRKSALIRVNSHFTWSKVSSMLADVYEALLVPEVSMGDKTAMKMRKKKQAA